MIVYFSTKVVGPNVSKTCTTASQGQNKGGGPFWTATQSQTITCPNTRSSLVWTFNSLSHHFITPSTLIKPEFPPVCSAGKPSNHTLKTQNQQHGCQIRFDRWTHSIFKVTTGYKFTSLLLWLLTSQAF